MSTRLANSSKLAGWEKSVELMKCLNSSQPCRVPLSTVSPVLMTSYWPEPRCKVKNSSSIRSTTLNTPWLVELSSRTYQAPLEESALISRWRSRITWSRM